ncbi:thioesterase domain-containing protein [Pseudogracilibacillus sp. SO30301A]
MELIIGIQKKGPYIFMGYSAGGTLAFELAKYMEQSGYVVSDIIMLDAQARMKKWLETEQDIINEAQFTVDFFTSQKVYKKYFDDVLKEELLENVKNYLTYWNNSFSTEMVDATIHQLKAIKTAETENFKHWEEHDKDYCLYEGSGTHYEMLIEPHLKKNAELLNNILANKFTIKV